MDLGAECGKNKETNHQRKNWPVENGSMDKPKKEFEEKLKKTVSKQGYVGNSLAHATDAVTKFSPLHLIENRRSQADSSHKRNNSEVEISSSPVRTPSFRVVVRTEEQWVEENVSKKRCANSEQRGEPPLKFLRTLSSVEKMEVTEVTSLDFGMSTILE